MWVGSGVAIATPSQTVNEMSKTSKTLIGNWVEEVREWRGRGEGGHF